MAITTDSYQNIQYSGNTVSQIGLSKTLDNYTWDEIFNYQYCSMCSALSRIVAPYAAQTNITSYDPAKLAYKVTITDSWDGDADFSAEQTGVIQYPQGLYSKIIWLRGTRTETRTYQLYNSNMSNFKLVTEWDAPNFIFTIPDPVSTFGDCATSWTDDESSVKTTWDTDDDHGEIKYRYRHDGTYTDIAISGNVMPYMLYKYGEHYYCQQLRQTPRYFGATIDRSGNDAKVGVNDLIYPVEDTTVNSLSFFAGNVSAAGFYYDSDRSGTGYNPWDGNYKLTTKRSCYCDFDNDDCMGRMQYAGTGPSQYTGITSYFKSKHASLLFWAGSGVKFYADKLYKPIIENGFVTDFTDDMTTPSDLDNWSGDSNHTVPDAPPAPAPSGTDEDNNDPIPVTGAPYSSGLARYYATTAGSVILSHISQAMGAWNLKDSGKDLYKNIISCKLIKSPAPIPVSGSEPFTVYGVTLQYDGSDITLPVINDNPTASFGSYNIPRKFNDFRDYAPYTKVEIYLPYCGWTVLPSHVVGRSVSVTYYTDIIAATCKAVVYCNSNVVAEAAGVIGLDIPMVTENAGAKAEAVTMGLLAYGKAGLQTALGVGAAVATKGKAGVKQAVSGLSDVVSAYSQTAMAFNQNYTEINGKNGDGCCIAGISAIVIKITRPKYGANTTPPYVPSNYAHSTGYVSMKSATVGSFTGLLVAANVDTSGISGATDREKQLIKLYLESGVYVNHPN